MKTLIKYIITLLVGVVLTAWLALSRDILEQARLINIYHILCDSFFAIGVVVTAVGALIFASNEGAFDPLVYGMRSFINIFRKRDKRKLESYFDYRMEKANHKFSFGYILICGVIFLAMSGVMYALYSKEYAAGLLVMNMRQRI